MNKTLDSKHYNRSYARTVGKSLSTLRKNLLAESLPRFAFTPDRVRADQHIFLEIGFGMGDHLLQQAKQRPDALYIGAEPYLNGVAKVLKSIVDDNLTNILLHAGDVNQLFAELPVSSLSGIYVLFPDPWPKKKQEKRRLVNEQRLSVMVAKIKIGGFFCFASDDEIYVQAVSELCHNCSALKPLPNIQSFLDDTAYQPTKYHQKALQAGKEVQFLCFVRTI